MLVIKKEINMRILRVQNEQQNGPYYTNRNKKADIICQMQDQHNAQHSVNCYPPTQMDKSILRRMKSEERCGFLNESQLYNWFSNKELKLLKENGFLVVEVFGEITIIGSHQILFIPVKQLN